MHIPDGYLSPGTCAGLYAASAPFWYVALRRMKKALHTRLVPLLSVFSAFSFIVMMFNLPLPGGTTGHATGVAVAAIVLGPSASILAMTTALVIQAIFFGDGGITAIGANSFNMAIIGSISAWAIYRVVAGRAAIDSPRRVVAAACAGYLSINMAALAAAVEFGIQPMFFHDASGAPLYAPYPLRIAIPAMMIGHLTVAGLAELVISAGVVGYLQRADPALLLATASGAISSSARTGAQSLRPLWLALAALMVLTPLGILAAGSAWGEWAPEEFGRAVSYPVAPSGLQRLSSIWTAPMPRYAPPFLHSAGFGYLLSAIAGAGLTIFIFLLAGWIGSQRKRQRD
jgi:cobalt/nickel transport system permease protein